MATGPYVIPNVKVDAVSALTNNTFTSAYRGFGAPQVCFAYESQMDELAEKLGLTPLEFRMRNYLHTGDELATGYALESAVLTDQTAERAWEALGEPTQPRSPDEVIGRGIASGLQSYGRLVYLHDSSRAYVGFELDGSVVVRSGVQDIGGGQASSIAQITAEVLGVPMDDITVYFGDTALTPLAGTTTATRMLYMSGNATLKAARTVRGAIVAQASEMLEVDPERIDLADRMVRVEGDEEKVLSIVDVVKTCASQGIPISDLAQFNAPSRDLEVSDCVVGQIHPDYTFGTHAAEVAVDTRTGKVTVLKLVAAFDVGQAINKLSAQGQLEGGTVCGVGYALLEDVKMDQGRTVTCALDTYLVPTAADMPDVEAIMLESRGGMGPFGAKGIGEPASTSGAPAVTNAVADAIGIRLTELPLTPERILTALKERDGSAGRAVQQPPVRVAETA
jgi:CO/xanthine dehydrogenase Mo-binding subunit